MSLPSLKPSILGPGPIVSASGMVSKSAPGVGGPPAPDFGALPIAVYNFLYS
jgi:hypothetical protein